MTTDASYIRSSEKGKEAKRKAVMQYLTGIFVIMRMVLALLLVSMSAFGQERFDADTILYGRTYTKRATEVYPLKTKLTMLGTDGSSVELSANDSGYFVFSNELIIPNTSYVITISANYRGEPHFMNTTHKFTSVGKTDADFPIKQDYFVDGHDGCGIGFARVFFERNSAELDSTSLRELKWSKETYDDHPTVVTEIGGRANSDEDNPAQLAYQRARVVYDHLLKMGVDSGRLALANYADTVFYVAKWRDYEFGYRDTLDHEYISQLTDPKVIEKARLFNSSVIFRVTRNDYVPKND